MIRFRTAASLFAWSLLASAPPSAQGLWSKVPPFPTTCFTQDQFYEQAGKAYEETLALYKKQYEENAAIDQRLRDLDAATQQSRMMAFMQKDPMNAGKFMQEAAMAGQRAGDMQADVDAKRKALKEQFETLQSQYKADMAKTDPLWTKFVDAQAHGSNATPAKINEYAAAFNAAYENRVCAKWWKTTSPFLPYLADFKRFAVESWIPLEEFVANTKRQSLDIMGIPSAGYKSPGEAQAVGEYLREAQKVFQLRFGDRARFP